MDKSSACVKIASNCERHDRPDPIDVREHYDVRVTPTSSSALHRMDLSSLPPITLHYLIHIICVPWSSCPVLGEGARADRCTPAAACGTPPPQDGAQSLP